MGNIGQHSGKALSVLTNTSSVEQAVVLTSRSIETTDVKLTCYECDLSDRPGRAFDLAFVLQSISFWAKYLQDINTRSNSGLTFAGG